MLDFDNLTAFEKALGFTKENYEILVDEIEKNFNIEKIKYKGYNGFGNTYEQIMPINGIGGKRANVCTAWIMRDGEKCYSLVSAYATDRKGDDND